MDDSLAFALYMSSYLGMAVLFVLCWFKIFRKAGYSGAMGILMVIPLVNAITFLYFVFSEWPILKEKVASDRRTEAPPYAA